MNASLTGSPIACKRPALGLRARVALSCACAALTGAASANAQPAFKIRVADHGVYLIAYEDLDAAGLPSVKPETAGIVLRSHGEEVPVWVDDGGDGRFGRGDWIEFVGNGVRRENDWLDPYLSHNVYVLDWNAKSPARLLPGAAPAQDVPVAGDNVYRVSRHLEEEELLPRFTGQRGDETGNEWYWAKLTHIDARPYSVTLPLGDLDTGLDGKATLRLRFRGWSRQAGRQQAKLADHRVEISVNGNAVKSAEWDGTDNHLIEVPDLATTLLRAGNNLVRLRIPARVPEGTEDPIVDVVMLDWMEIDYPRSDWIDEPQTTVSRASSDGAQRAFFDTRFKRDLAVYTDDGQRIADKAIAAEAREDGSWRHSFELREQARVLDVVADAALRAPLSIARDDPSTLAGSSNGADYIIITHERLEAAIQPLADFHRARGLAVITVDVEDIYDEFYYGLPHPEAIRRFLAHAYKNWAPPRPRFVLLVGDASWDTKHEMVATNNYDDLHFRPGLTRFAKVPAAPYKTKARLNHRNLIPAGNYNSGQGHSASDNWFVTIDGDDFYPDMAIGRFPVTEPEEVAAIVKKTIRYGEGNDIGPWRRKILWITNEQKWPQQISERLANEVGARGFASRKVYPDSSEANNEHHQVTLREAFDEGQLLVHFHGHGGRYIWRTGPPDLRKNHDLFTLKDLDLLEPSERLPVVLSMSCYSAPFDHPNADSIGEKFLRMPGKGAVAVLAASWRNSPAESFSAALMRELTKPGTIGEAIQRAKNETRSQVLVEQYNLLGDPALELAMPSLGIHLEAEGTGTGDATGSGEDAVAGAGDGGEGNGGAGDEGGSEKDGAGGSGGGGDKVIHITGRTDTDDFRGKAIVEWLDGDDEILLTDELAVKDNTFEASFDTALLSAEPHQVRVYAWNSKEGVDGIGALNLGPEEEDATEAEPRRILGAGPAASRAKARGWPGRPPRPPVQQR